MRIVLGVLEADAGAVTWRGDRQPDPAAGDVGLPPRGARPLPADDRSLDQLVVLRVAVRRRTGPGAPRGAPLAGQRFRVPELADRRADELSKGNQQKIQLIAAILHDPEVLLMDEPFTGLDPVNVAILPRGVPRAPRPGQDADLLDPPDGDGRGAVRVDRDRRPRPGRRRRAAPRDPAGGRAAPRPPVGRGRPSAAVARRASPGPGSSGAGFGRTEIELDEGVDPDAILSAAIAAGATVTHFEVDEVSLEQIFIDHVGRPADEDEHLAPDGDAARRRTATRPAPAAAKPGVARDEPAAMSADRDPTATSRSCPTWATSPAASTRRWSAAGCSSSRRWSSPASRCSWRSCRSRPSSSTAAARRPSRSSRRDRELSSARGVAPGAARRGRRRVRARPRGHDRAGRRRRRSLDRELDAAIVAIRHAERVALVQLPPRRDDGPAADRQPVARRVRRRGPRLQRAEPGRRASSSRRSTSSERSAGAAAGARRSTRRRSRAG